MTLIFKDKLIFIDEKYGLIKNIYDLPSYPGLPRVYVKMAFGGNYSTSGFNASGAGITNEQAINSAVGEYIERYSCLHPSVLQKINKSLPKVNPKELNPQSSTIIDKYKWIKGIKEDLKSEVLLPVDAVYLTYKSESNNREWVTTSTGAACGSSLEECYWKGIAEILERDSFQYNWRKQLACPQIDIVSNENLLNFYKKYIQTQGVKISLYAFSMDWHAPSVFGIAELPNGGCVVAASVRDTWLDASKKTLLELAQSLVGYAAILYNRKVKEKITDFSLIREYQDHSLLYFSNDMARYLDFLNNDVLFSIPEKEPIRTNKEKLDFFITAIENISKSIYFVDVTSPEVKNTNWLVAKAIIPGMLDIEPDFIPTLKSERFHEVDDYLLLNKKRTYEELHKPQPLVPHPFP